MPNLSETFTTNVPYVFVAVGIAWIVVIVLGGSLLLLWPGATSIASGALLKTKPEERFSGALSRASALFGLILSGYQAYTAVPLFGTLFSTIAAYSFVSFAVVALVNLALLVEKFSPKGTEK